jgi:hypothetical protein
MIMSVRFGRWHFCWGLKFWTVLLIVLADVPVRDDISREEGDMR